MDAMNAEPAGKPGSDSSRAGDREAAATEWDRLLALDRDSETGVLPPEVIATPSQMGSGPGTDNGITWWQPGWRDMWRYVGYRWVFLIPALLLPFGLLLPLRFYNAGLIVIWVKLLVLPMVGVSIWLTRYVLLRAVRARKEPFCVFCGYNLSGLPDNYRCPECGRPYTWRLIAEYRRDPQWFVERYRARTRLPAADAPFAAGPVHRRSRDGT